MWEVALQSLYFMMVCLSRPHEGFKPASAHFRMFWTTSGEDFVVTDGPLNNPEPRSHKNCSFDTLSQKTV